MERQLKFSIRYMMPALLGLVLGAAPLAAETRLLMVEEDGCIYCARWNKDVSTEYPKTDEGKAAPLWRVDLHEPLPEGITLDGRLVYTPTFVLLDDGVEVGRIEGYPGEDFFWGLLSRLLTQVESEEQDDDIAG